MSSQYKWICHSSVKPFHSILSAGCSQAQFFARAAGIPLVLGLGAVLNAQDVVAPTTSVPVVPTALQQTMQAQGAVNTASIQSVASSTEGAPPFQAGPVIIEPHFFYRFLYGDGLQAVPGRESNTAINSISPGVLFNLGTHWSFDYTPTWNLYSNSAFHDSVDESARLSAWSTYENWTLNFDQSYLYQNEPLIETGQQTSETDYATDIGASCHLNSLLILELGANQTYRTAPGFPSSLEWSTEDWLDYILSPNTTLGAGGGLGYVEESEGPNEFYVRPELQLKFKATQKISIVLHAGLENRRFVGQAGSDFNNPVYDAAIEYRPVDTTTLSLTAAEAISTSIFENQTTKSNQVGAKIEQRLLEHFFLSGEVDQERVDYLALGSTGAAPSIDRDDKTLSYTVRLGTTFIKKGTLSLLYERTRNDSTQGGFGFTSNQVGLELGYRF